MAITASTPTYRTPEPAPDLVTFTEAVELLRPTGHPVTVQRLHRHAVRAGVPVFRRGKDNTASWSDLLQVHADMFPPPAPSGPQ